MRVSLRKIEMHHPCRSLRLASLRKISRNSSENTRKLLNVRYRFVHVFSSPGMSETAHESFAPQNRNAPPLPISPVGFAPQNQSKFFRKYAEAVECTIPFCARIFISGDERNRS